ncbi:alpha/beta-type small acid-soluble spore protein [Paenibacillus sp. IB182496]|uniref:Alpha/beta-type small acid-soluble spore protein n=1 Tax=Paenibacillus sabuli TaxID=2772509 RepID=A0A927GSB4_9BACL|nr:alpha/beta-type small acid-soluble spore protein [Paenibacillus sabuli]MBD2845850.1 alpha/beta-type small acid-soluble spore protein [Paenibacillus sabuli]
MAGRSNQKVVPACKPALDQMKYEIAAELGLYVHSGSSPAGGADAEFAGELGAQHNQAAHVPWSQLATREAGSVGGEITRRIIQQAQQGLH